ncbi:MAG: hypothetical protein R2939_19940 [Kofleriaceae bacterium]
MDGARLLLSVLGALVVAPASATADDDAGPRSVGRAGTGLVSDDGLGAVSRNPAAMARRDLRRAQLAVVVDDDDASAARAGARTATTSHPPRFRFGLGAQDAVGPMVVGVALTSDGDGRALPAPPAGVPTSTVEADYLDRYAGLTGARRERTLAVAAATRVTDALAIGVAATIASVHLEERRRVWAGFSGRDPIGSAARDLEFALAGDDGLVPGAAFGALVAPASIPLELGLAISFRNAVHLDGTARGTADPTELRVDDERGAAALTLASPVIVRAGARYLGERALAEVGLELHRLRPAAATPSWTLDRVRAIDRTGAAVDVTEVASRAGRRSHAVLRGAVDVELVPGLAWATAGYAYATQASPADGLAATWADLGGHTAAIGLEAAAGDVVVIVGYARTWSPTITVERSSLGYDDPFGPAPGDVGAASFAGHRDQLGLSVEVAWP